MGVVAIVSLLRRLLLGTDLALDLVVDNTISHQVRRLFCLHEMTISRAEFSAGLHHSRLSAEKT